MWDKILLLTTSSLTADSSKIEDGITAIVCNPGSNLYLSNNRFHSNHISVLLADTGTTPDLNSLNDYLITNNLFDCNYAVLKPPYTNNAISYAGIISNRYNFTIGEPNKFEKMQYGIIGINSDLNFFYQQFKQIRHYNPDSSFAAGICIYARNASLHTLIVEGNLGIDGTYTFMNSRVGIFANNSNVVCSQSLFNGINFGILIQNSNYAYFSIRSNQMYCSLQGVFISTSDHLHSIIIGNNLIKMDAIAPLQLTSANSAITYNAPTANIPPLYGGAITRNYLISNNTRFGIVLRLASGIVVSDNSIEMIHTSPAMGINLIRGHKLSVYCNNIKGNGADYQNLLGSNSHLPVGISLDQVKHSTIKCNSIERIFTGLSVFNMCNQTKLKANHLLIHRQGIYYDSTAQTGWQPLHGNIFDDDYSTNTTHFGGVNMGGITSSFFNQFRFNESDLPFSHPQRVGIKIGSTLQTYYGTNFSGQGWFIPWPDTSYRCISDSTICAQRDIRFEEPDTIIEDAYLLQQQLTHGDSIQQWNAALYFYQFVQSNPALQNDPLWAAYATQLTNSYIASFAEQQEGYRQLYRLSTNDSLLSDSLQSVIRRHQNEIDSLQQAATIITNSLTTSALAQSLHKLSITLKRLSSLYRQYTLRAESGLDTLTQQNETLPDNALYMLNEKTVNGIYYKSLQRTPPHFTESEQSLLFYIGLQCPNTGGEAVHTARSLYSSIDPLYWFNDAELCGTMGAIPFRNTENGTGTAEIMLYPNPTNDYCLINGLSSSGNLLIYDTKGTLYLQKINFEASVYTIYTANWPPGVYIIQYIDDSHTTNFKLIVQHL
jgi:hypothetical protein